MHEQHAHVALAVDRVERQLALLLLRLIAERLGRLADRGLMLDQHLHLRRQFGDAQSPGQIQPLGGQPRDDLANFRAGAGEILGPVIGIGLLGIDQNLDDIAHLGFDQPVDVLTHRLDVAINVFLLHAVLLELFELHVEHAGDQLAGHFAGPLLQFLAAAQRLGAERAVGPQPSRGQEIDRQTG